MARTRGAADLQIAVDRARPEPLRDQIVGAIASGIAGGCLRPGTPLAASRTLAVDLGVSRGVVVEAYAELAERGLIVVRSRALPRVAEIVVRPVEPGVPVVPRLDLTPGTPDLALFPRREWLAATAWALRSMPDRSLGAGDGRGELALRGALADYLGRARGAVIDPDAIVVTVGATQAIALACQLLAALGHRTVALPPLCRPATRAAVRNAGLAVAIGRSSAAAIVAANPVGPAAESVRAGCSMIVLDDRGSEFRFAGPSTPALQASAPDDFLLAGSVSQSLAPGLRIGWLAVPAALAAEAARLRLLLDGGSPAIEQVALARLIETGAYERHLRRVRVEYRRRRAALIAALADGLPEVTAVPSDGGLQLVLELPSAIERIAFDRRRAAERIAVAALEDFAPTRSETVSAIVVGFAGTPVASARPVVHALRRLLDPEPPRARPGLRRPVGEAARPLRGRPGDEVVELSILVLDVGGADPDDDERFAVVLAGVGADVVCLQNTCGRTRRLAAVSGYEHVIVARNTIARYRLLQPPDRPYLLVELRPGRHVAIANVHLSNERYGPGVLARGGSWEAVEDDERRIRVPEIAPVAAALADLGAQGIPAILAGSLNSPCDPGWPVADALAAFGLRDVYAGLRPDARGVTWPVPGAPVADEGADRIDGTFVAGPVVAEHVALVGEQGGADVDLAFDRWPGDHRGVLTRLAVTPGFVSPFIAVAGPSLTSGAVLEAVVVADADEIATVSLVRAGGDGARPALRRSAAERTPTGVVRLPTRGLTPGAYDLVGQADDGSRRARTAVWVASAGAQPTIGVGAARVRAGEPVTISWRDAPGCWWDWVAVFAAADDPSTAPPIVHRFTGATPVGSVVVTDPIAPGRYVVALLLDDTGTVLAVAGFSVVDR